MKEKILSLTRLKRAALLVLLLCVVGMGESLAQTQVATLQHGDSICAFYGTSALYQAHDAAVDGDVITLSSGTFSATNISKNITLNGAGCAYDTLSGTSPTYVTGNFTVSSSLNMEGLNIMSTITFSPMQSSDFIRCSFHEINYSGYGAHFDNRFINCKIRSFHFASNGAFYDNTFFNCVINSFYLIDTNITHITTAYNCVIRLWSSVHALQANNCIISSDYDSDYLCNASIAENCIGINNGEHDVFDCSNHNCMIVDSYSEVFVTYDGSFSEEEDYRLIDEIATGFLGNDGTEVGIHGGMVPYQTRPFYLLPVRYNVANRSTIDGKLSVEIEVVTEGE